MDDASSRRILSSSCVADPVTCVLSERLMCSSSADCPDSAPCAASAPGYVPMSLLCN
jgi:hypothetical protein